MSNYQHIKISNYVRLKALVLSYNAYSLSTGSNSQPKYCLPTNIMDDKINIKPLQKLLSSNNRLGELAKKSRSLFRLNELTIRSLPPAIRPYCELQSYEKGALIIGTPTSAAATQLRFMSGAILKKLKQHREFSGLQSIKIKVTPNAQRIARPMRRPPNMSDRNKALLLETANHINSPEIAQSLRKLVQTINKYKT